MADRDITDTEVRRVLSNWENRWASDVHRGVPTPNTFMYQLKDLCVVTVEEPGSDDIIIRTVLLKSAHQWADEDARCRSNR